MSADSGPGRREVAYRLFAAEFDDATLSYSESDEERAPNYVVTPTGARVNRLFAVGVLTEVERVNEDVLRARIADPTGAFVTYAGQYQPEAMATLDRTEPPAFVSITGKARTFSPEDSDRVFTSARPESVNVVDAETRDRWVVTAAEATLRRVARCAEALAADERGEALRLRLLDEGAPEDLAAGIPLAIDHYGTTTAYLEALRTRAVEALEVVAGERDSVSPLDVAPDEVGDGAASVGPLPAPVATTAAGEGSGASGDASAASSTATATETSAGAETSAEAGADAETSAEAGADAETSAEAGADAETSADAGADAETSADADADAETSADADADASPAAGSSPGTGAEPGTTTERPTDAEPTAAPTGDDESVAAGTRSTTAEASAPGRDADGAGDAGDAGGPAVDSDPSPAGDVGGGGGGVDDDIGEFDDGGDLGGFDDAGTTEEDVGGFDDAGTTEEDVGGFDDAGTTAGDASAVDDPDGDSARDADRTSRDDAGDAGGAGADVDADADADDGTGVGASEPATDAAEQRYEFDDEERERVEEEYGAEFSTGTEVEEPGEADIDVPDPEDLAEMEPGGADAERSGRDAGGESGADEPDAATPDAGVASVGDGDGDGDEADADAPDAPDAGGADGEDEDVDLEDAAVTLMEALDDGGGAEREAVVAELVDRHGATPEEAEEAIREALMDGKCYEPDDGRLTAI